MADTYRVTRWCCTSGLCHECHARGNHGDMRKRKRIVHTYGVSRATALRTFKGWNIHGFEPKMEKEKQ